MIAYKYKFTSNNKIDKIIEELKRISILTPIEIVKTRDGIFIAGFDVGGYIELEPVDEMVKVYVVTTNPYIAANISKQFNVNPRRVEYCGRV